ncbi:MAG TPA: undecaprenyl-diphosphate phosphatase [Solirubrobacteraceae bacterium]|nr:undecaprenyl-diphosphate phosphatase [Solirubrobacteraceae bacterium]
MITAAVAHHISTFQAIVLGVLQGVSELFPVSSLGHTVLFPHLFGWNDIVKWQSQPESPWLAFIVMLHVGSAIGLLVYFWKDWLAIIGAFFTSLSKRRIETPTERLAWLIICASIPTGLIGLAIEHPARVATAKPLIAAIFLVVNGFILLGAERLRRAAELRERRAEARAAARARGERPVAGDEGAEVRSLDTLAYREAGVIGVFQSAALIAGISRDGIVMAAGLLRGLDNYDAGRLGFLLATPIILAAGVYKLGDLTGPNGAGIRGAAVIAAAAAAVTAVFTVHFLTRYFRRGNLNPFGVYCVLFGVAMVVYNAV